MVSNWSRLSFILFLSVSHFTIICITLIVPQKSCKSCKYFLSFTFSVYVCLFHSAWPFNTNQSTQQQPLQRCSYVLINYCCCCCFFVLSVHSFNSIPGVINEPPLPRRKKCPELAYRTHEFITGETRTKNDINASTYNGRARVSVMWSFNWFDSFGWLFHFVFSC